MADSKLKKSLLSGATVATPEQSSAYFKPNDARWGETLRGGDSPTGKPIILINDRKFLDAGVTNYRDKAIMGESLHLLKEVDPNRHKRLLDSALSSPEYRRWMKNSYRISQQEYGEDRGLSEWHDYSRFDQIIGGYLFAGDKDLPTMKN